jgi:hypothetical protein
LVLFRNLKSIDSLSFEEDLLALPILTEKEMASTLEDLITQENEGISSVLDRHVLLNTRRITIRPENPWTSRGIFFEIRIGVRTRATMATNLARGRRAAASEVFVQSQMGYFSCQGKLPGEDDHGVR